MSYIYILSSKSNPGRYKVGRASSQKRLVNKYIDAIPDLEVHRFERVFNTRSEVALIFEGLRLDRLDNAKGDPSSWFHTPLESVNKALDYIIYRQRKKSEDDIENVLRVAGI